MKIGVLGSIVQYFKKAYTIVYYLLYSFMVNKNFFFSLQVRFCEQRNLKEVLLVLYMP